MKKASVVGYFSRYKDLGPNNLSCIVVFPAHQKKGYGKFLIELSYYFSRKEKRISTPELPLSESGRILYLSYWKQTLIKKLQEIYTTAGTKSKAMVELKKQLCGSLNPVRDLSRETFITEVDVATTLKDLRLMKYYKGQSILAHQAEINKACRLYFGKERPITAQFNESNITH